MVAEKTGHIFYAAVQIRCGGALCPISTTPLLERLA